MSGNPVQKRSEGYQSRRDVVEAELQPGEQLLWLGGPNPMRMALSSAGAALFGVPWTAFWLWALLGHFTSVSWAWWPAALFYGIPLWIGYLSAPAPYWSWRAARRTAYAVTDRRVLIVRRGKARTVDSYAPDGITDAHRTERRDGSGDLVLARGFRDSITLQAIPEVGRVERLVRSLVTDRVPAAAAAAASVPLPAAAAQPSAAPPDTVTASRAPWWTHRG